MHSAQNVGANNFVMMAFLGIGALRYKHRNGHESGPRQSCQFLDRCILHRISVRTTLRRRHFSFRTGSSTIGAKLGLKKSMRSGSNPAAPSYKFSPVRLGARFQHVCSVRAWVARRCGQPRLGYHPGKKWSFPGYDFSPGYPVRVSR